MKNGNLLIAIVVGGVIGFVVGRTTNAASEAPAKVAAAQPSAAQPGAVARVAGAAQAPDGEPVYKVPVGVAQTRGPETAKVTIIEFSEYECPFCSRVMPTMKQIEDTYGKDVRIAFKHNPLPFHANAPLASKAALAAAEQGKFWEMTDKLFANQKALQRDNLIGYAKELGLDVGRFTTAMESGKFDDQIASDMAEAANFGARGTPGFFINGRNLRGAQPFAAFKKIIDEEIVKADAALARGVKAKDLYAELTKNGLTKAAPPAPQPAAQPQAPEAAKVQKIDDIAGSPVKGPANAKVTIVAWSEFQCPFCARVLPTLQQIEKEYPKDVRVIFKHQPLSFHPNARPAAIASMAAHQQGKFWEFHDKAFANQQGLSDANYEKWAKEIGLDMAKFNKALSDPKIAAQVDADSKYGMSVGANGTPSFFINGHELSGAQPFPAFKAIIDQEIKAADALLAKGVKPAELYGKILEANVASAPKVVAPAPDKPVTIDVGNSPFKGPKNAKVTIVAFSDFECPFCSRVNPTMDQIMKDYAGKVRVAFKNQPLPFHSNAKPAAEAALAAGEQGKFWEFHDKAFANQRALTRANFETWAKELGLDVGKFKSALDSGKFGAQVDADQALANSVGASGTPTFFVNGRKLVGAQPFEQFKALIDEELAK